MSNYKCMKCSNLFDTIEEAGNHVCRPRYTVIINDDGSIEFNSSRYGESYTKLAALERELEVINDNLQSSIGSIAEEQERITIYRGQIDIINNAIRSGGYE